MKSLHKYFISSKLLLAENCCGLLPILSITKFDPFLSDVQKMSRLPSTNTRYWSSKLPARLTAIWFTVAFVCQVVTSFWRDAPGIKSNTWITVTNEKKKNVSIFGSNLSDWNSQRKTSYSYRHHNHEWPHNVVQVKLSSHSMRWAVKTDPNILVLNAVAQNMWKSRPQHCPTRENAWKTERRAFYHENSSKCENKILHFDSYFFAKMSALTSDRPSMMESAVLMYFSL